MLGDGSTDAPHDRLVRRLMKAGVSKYHPDPLRALKEAAA